MLLMWRIWPDIRRFKKTGIDRTGELLLEKKTQKSLYKILVLCILYCPLNDTNEMIYSVGIIQ